MDARDDPIAQFHAKHYERHLFPNIEIYSCISLRTFVVCLSSVQYIPNNKWKVLVTNAFRTLLFNIIIIYRSYHINTGNDSMN
jgi:hypothetical protein